MMNKRLTSEQMERLLERLGYHLMPSKGAQRVFENPKFNAVQILPPAGQEPYSRVEHLMTLRKVSIEKGIVDTEAFDALLEQLQQDDSRKAETPQSIAAA
jgi:predicted RNA binding protein YcfA (HicA-like mRNA interferase family)